MMSIKGREYMFSAVERNINILSFKENSTEFSGVVRCSLVELKHTH
jgi:hypothetical protein